MFIGAGRAWVSPVPTIGGIIAFVYYSRLYKQATRAVRMLSESGVPEGVVR
jgi:hypothetical protein